METDSAIEKVQSQNDRLRSEIAELNQAFQGAMKKHRQQELKNKRVPIQAEKNGDANEQELRRIYARVKKYKNEIVHMKSYIDSQLHGTEIMDLENEETYLKGQLSDLTSEFDSLVRVEKDQLEALDEVNNAQGYPTKMKALNDQLSQAKSKYRELLAKQAKDEKILKKHHIRYVGTEKKNRKMQAAIRESLKRPQYDSEEPRVAAVTAADIDELRQKVSLIEEGKRKEEANLKKKLFDLKKSLSSNKSKIQTLDIQLKEKDQACRLNDLKISEMKRITRFGQLKPLNKIDEPRRSQPKLQSLHEIETKIPKPNVRPNTDNDPLYDSDTYEYDYEQEY